MQYSINQLFDTNEDSSNFGGKGRAKRQAKRDLKASGMSGKEAKQALKNSPCGKKPSSKSNIEQWKQCLIKNGLSPSQADEVEKAGGIDGVSDEKLDNALKIDLSEDESNNDKNNTLLYVGLGIGVVAVLGFTAWLVFRKK